MSVRPRRARAHRIRVRVLVVGFSLIASLFALRLVQLQVLNADEWRRLAKAQSATEVQVPARRGGIYDRHGRPLAVDGQEFRGFLAPKELRDGPQAVATVGRLLGLSRAERTRLLSASQGWVAIPRRLTNDDRQRLQGAIRQGIYFDPIPSRSYPGRELARSILGAVDAEGAGATGLELYLDSLLRGTPGAALTRRDALGQTYWIPGAQLAEPQQGHEVVLTIDAELQAIAENALDRAIVEMGAAGGDILLMDAKTGELLAVASRRDGHAGVPAFTDPYEPGSTLKPFLLAGLLSEGAARLDEWIDVQKGILREGSRVIKDVHSYDSLTVAGVVIFSSNVGAAKLARRLSPSEQYSYLRNFGFGLATGLAFPAEDGGLLRRPAQWSELSQASLAIGYELSVTSVQLVAAYGALANGGVLLRPRLVREIRDPMGRIVVPFEPEPVRRVVNSHVADHVAEVLTRTVAEGTGMNAALESLPVAGKTGTAKLVTDGRYGRRYASSFIGFTPADDPEFVLLTKIEDPQGPYYGGTVAAPIIRATLQAALATRGVMIEPRRAVMPARRRAWGPAETVGTRPSEPFIFAVGREPAPWPEAAGHGELSTVLPDLRGLPVRAAAARLHELGLRVELRASGRIVTQQPTPGASVARGATVVLR